MTGMQEGQLDLQWYSEAVGFRTGRLPSGDGGDRDYKICRQTATDLHKLPLLQLQRPWPVINRIQMATGPISCKHRKAIVSQSAQANR